MERIQQPTRRRATTRRTHDELAATGVVRPQMGAAAVIALQRSVGNQATLAMLGHGTPVLQRSLLTASQVKDWIRWVRDPADRANSTRCMLAIYNQMRLSLDPTPAEFRSLADARQTLIQRKQIDQEDVDALEAEAARLQQAGGDPVALLRNRMVEKIAARYNAADAAYGPHIFQGDLSGTQPTGYHSKADGSATHETYGQVTQIGNGVYQQSVRTRTPPRVKKKNQSTFFPDAASHRQVIEAIASVYEAGLSTVGFVDPVVNGLKLAKRGDTVYPAGGSDRLLAE
jgi:hypothetical protein